MRDTAFRACQVLVFMFARSHTDLLLPALEDSLMDESWRIRDSGVRLLGDFLHRLAGAKSAINYDVDDEEFEATGGESASASVSNDIRAAIETSLGRETHDRVLASLYLARADVISFVRTSAWRVWKSIISATPRIVRELLPTLMNLIIDALAAESNDRQTAAGSTLGELVSKMGDAVLPVVVPILKASLSSSRSHARPGVGLGLSELLRSAHKAQIGAYMQEIIPTILRALCDEDPDVRDAAAVAYETLLKNTGQRAVDETVPVLVQQLLEQGAAGTYRFAEDDEEEDDEEDSDDDDDSDSDSKNSDDDDDGEDTGKVRATLNTFAL